MNKCYILKKNEDIKELFSQKKSVGNRYFSIYYDKGYHKNDEDINLKMVVSVSKKVGKAHLRNYLRRVMKEIVRKNIEDFNNLRLLIVVKRNAVELSYVEKEKELLKLIKKIRGIKDEK